MPTIASCRITNDSISPITWLVAVIACFFGYRSRKRDGAEGVGIATNKAIVISSVTCIVVNMFISAIMYT